MLIPFLVIYFCFHLETTGFEPGPVGFYRSCLSFLGENVSVLLTFLWLKFESCK